MSDNSPEARLRDGRVWHEFCDRLREAGDRIVAASPDNDFDRAEGLRYLARLTHHFLRSTLDESDPAAARLSTLSPKIGLDNPDYVYAGARLSSRFAYRLRGQMGDAQLLGIGTFSGGLGTPEGLVRDGYLTSDQLPIDPDGRFELRISREEQAAPWLPMSETTNSLNIRQTLLERSRQEPANLILERVDGGAAPEPLSPARLVGALDRSALMVAGVVGQFLGWTESFQQHPHEIREIDPSLLAFAQGDPNTTYHYSYWDLGPEEALVIEFLPPACDYWNLQIGNHWLESLDYLHRQTHVNHATAETEADGLVRIVVAHRDPGVPNWLDTAGHERGALALRFVGAVSAAATRTRLVALESLTR